MQAWRERAVRGVWLKIPIYQSQLIPLAVCQGFAFHHAERTHAMLTTWLPDTPSTLPPNASHQVGVGVVVRNAHGDIVTVKERSGLAAKYDIWKVPTGLLDEHEDFHDAAVREVKEETVRGAFWEVSSVIAAAWSRQTCRPVRKRVVRVESCESESDCEHARAGPRRGIRQLACCAPGAWRGVWQE